MLSPFFLSGLLSAWKSSSSDLAIDATIPQGSIPSARAQVHCGFSGRPGLKAEKLNLLHVGYIENFKIYSCTQSPLNLPEVPLCSGRDLD